MQEEEPVLLLLVQEAANALASGFGLLHPVIVADGQPHRQAGGGRGLPRQSQTGTSGSAGMASEMPERTFSAGGTDHTLNSSHYMWLKKFLQSRGAAETDLTGLNLERLRLFALQEGFLTTESLQQAERTLSSLENDLERVASEKSHLTVTLESTCGETVQRPVRPGEDVHHAVVNAFSLSSVHQILELMFGGSVIESGTFEENGVDDGGRLVVSFLDAKKWQRVRESEVVVFGLMDEETAHMRGHELAPVRPTVIHPAFPLLTAATADSATGPTAREVLERLGLVPKDDASGTSCILVVCTHRGGTPRGGYLFGVDESDPQRIPLARAQKPLGGVVDVSACGPGIETLLNQSGKADWSALQELMSRKQVLVVLPDLRREEKALVMKMHHFTNELLVQLYPGSLPIDDESFIFDDECMRPDREARVWRDRDGEFVEGAGEFWTYVGK